jgi:hypothetical protein
MADTDGTDTLPSNEYANVLNGTPVHPAIPQTPEGNASFDEFGTPQESHHEIPPTDCGETPPNNPNASPLAKVLFDTPSASTTEGTDKISGPTETLATPPLNRTQPKPATSPRAINLARRMKYNEPYFEEGYDSDGEIGPHSFVVEEEGEQDFDEGALPSAPPAQQQQPLSVAVPEDTTEVLAVSDEKSEHSGHVPIAEEALLGMKRAAIAVELRKRGQVVGGTKLILLDRLRLALANKIPVGKKKRGIKKVENPTGKTGNETAGFATGSYWQPLEPSSIVDEPLNPSFTTAVRAPTIPVGEADVVPVKHDFAEVFDRPRFSGTYERVVTHRNTRVRYDATGKIATERLPREKGGPNPAFVKKHKLSIHSHPADFAEVFVPYKKILMTAPSSIQASRLGQTILIRRQLCLKLVRVGIYPPPS